MKFEFQVLSRAKSGQPVRQRAQRLCRRLVCELLESRQLLSFLPAGCGGDAEPESCRRAEHAEGAGHGGDAGHGGNTGSFEHVGRARSMYRAAAQRGEGESSGGRGGAVDSIADLSSPFAPSSTIPPISASAGSNPGAISAPVYMVQAGPAMFVFPPLASSVVLVSQPSPAAPVVTNPVATGDDGNAGLGNHQAPPPIVPPLLDSVLVETPSRSESGSSDSDESRGNFHSPLTIPLAADLLAPGLTGSALVGPAVLGASLVVADTADGSNGSGGDADLMVLPWEDWGSSRELPKTGNYSVLEVGQTNTISQRLFETDDSTLPDLASRATLSESLDLVGGDFLEMRDFMFVDYVHDAPTNESDGWWTGDASRAGFVAESGDETAERFASTDELFRRWRQPAVGNPTESSAESGTGRPDRSEASGQSETTRGVEYLRIENGRAVYQVLDVIVAVEDAAGWNLPNVANAASEHSADGVLAAGDEARKASPAGSSESAVEPIQRAAPVESAALDDVPTSTPPADASASPLTKAILLPGLLATLFWRRRESRAEAPGKVDVRR